MNPTRTTVSISEELPQKRPGLEGLEDAHQAIERVVAHALAHGRCDDTELVEVGLSFTRETPRVEVRAVFEKLTEPAPPMVPAEMDPHA